MKNLQATFSGKKTYIVAILLVALGILQGETQTILEGLGLLTLRQGVAKMK